MKLRKCPFCGSNDVERIEGFIVCNGCGIKVVSESEITEKWNTRDGIFRQPKEPRTDFKGRCGSCFYYIPYAGKARGRCGKFERRDIYRIVGGEAKRRMTSEVRERTRKACSLYKEYDEGTND